MAAFFFLNIKKNPLMAGPPTPTLMARRLKKSFFAASLINRT